MATRFPFIVSGNYATFKGDFFVNKGDHWRKIERYLPAATGCYGEPIETTANKWLAQLNNGLEYKSALAAGGGILNTRYALTETGFTPIR